MRQWMVDPRIMCRKHLLGEHVEHHMFIGTLKKGRSVQGFIDNNLFEPSSIHFRHHQLVEEMRFRGYNHRSPITDEEWQLIAKLPDAIYYSHINRKKSLDDLLSRCPECRERYNQLKGEQP